MQTVNANIKTLEETRQKVNQSTDEQLEQAMREDWEQETFLLTHGQEISDADLNRVKRQIDRQVKRPRSMARYIRIAIQAAAAILLPVCIVGFLYMYHQNKQYAAIPMTKIVTQDEDQVTVTLPDGTRVTVNSHSELQYAPQTFCMDTREVTFEGEGYYQVAKDLEHPFIIHSHGMDIHVLGTEFNFINRKKENTAQVALINGSVKLTSLVSGKSYTMKPNEIAYIDKTTGNMDIQQAKHIEDVKAWRQKQMRFHDVPLSKVIQEIEAKYGVSIRLEAGTNDTFTGTLPTNNLQEAIKIVAMSYGLKVNKANKRYILR